MSQAKRYREDYQRKLKARETDELKWFEENLEKVEQKRYRREMLYTYVGGALITALLVLIWMILRSRWLLFEIPPVGLIVIGGVFSIIGIQAAAVLEFITRK